MESQGYYADPNTIEREAAPGGEMYAMVDKSNKKKVCQYFYLSVYGSYRDVPRMICVVVISYLKLHLFAV